MLNIISLLLFWAIFDIPYLSYRMILFYFNKMKIASLKKPFVSILIPAYNEEIGIEKTLKSCISQTYPNFEIIVINDGSKDNTKKIIRNFIRHYSQHKIVLLNQKNSGKAKALNHGLKTVRGDFIITVDADSKLHYKAVELIMAAFTSKKIGAVAGNIVALSNRKILGMIQRMEYEVSTNFLRESQSAIGAVTVTPGAFSAYRKIALKKFEEGTLTEDFDSSVKILEKGYDIIIAPEAICYTQVPLNIPDLIKQRRRWQQGGMEVFAKHLFREKRFFVSFEMFLIFFFGFYGLFPKMISLVVLPLVIFSGNVLYFFYGFLIFLLYFDFIWTLKLLIIEEKDIRMYLVVPLFVIYWYTIILYSILAAQILVLKKQGGWGQLKRYHI